MPRLRTSPISFVSIYHRIPWVKSNLSSPMTHLTQYWKRVITDRGILRGTPTPSVSKWTPDNELAATAVFLGRRRILQHTKHRNRSIHRPNKLCSPRLSPQLGSVASISMVIELTLSSGRQTELARLPHLQGGSIKFEPRPLDLIQRCLQASIHELNNYEKG